MKPLFDINNIDNLTDSDLIFECYHCQNEFKSTKRYLRRTIQENGELGHTLKFCSQRCSGTFYKKDGRVEVSCALCGKNFSRTKSELRSKKGNSFCSKSCSAKYNNSNKSKGSKRSKMEIWIEENLRKKYNFEIIFNGKNEIDSELDIYIPHLKLAFELNGIFHYEPIYGEEKLENIRQNDYKKIYDCQQKNIELHTIDTRDSKNFKASSDVKYLKMIQKIIDFKL